MTYQEYVLQGLCYHYPTNICVPFLQTGDGFNETPCKISEEKPGIKIKRLDQNFEVFLECAAKKYFLNAKD